MTDRHTQKIFVEEHHLSSYEPYLHQFQLCNECTDLSRSIGSYLPILVPGIFFSQIPFVLRSHSSFVPKAHTTMSIGKRMTPASFYDTRKASMTLQKNIKKTQQKENMRSSTLKLADRRTDVRKIPAKKRPGQAVKNECRL